MSQNKIKNLKRILGKVAFEHFLEEYFEQKYLFLKGRNKKIFDDLVSLDELDSLLSSMQIAKNSIRLVKNGEIVSESKYILKHESTEMVSNEKILDHFMDGTTIILEGIHRYVHGINLLAKDLQAAFNAPVMINCYITPQNSYGFKLHFDSHCVFILQIAGEKRWELYNDVQQELPTLEHFESKSINNFGKPIELVLSAGDVLYIPRGIYHAAKSQNSFSVHLTIGIYPLLVKDLFTSFVNNLNSLDIGLRRSVLTTAVKDTSLISVLSGVVHQIPDNLIKTISAEKIMKEDLWPIQRNRFTNLCYMESININTCVKIKDGLRYDIKKNGETFDLQFNNKQVTLPVDILVYIQRLQISRLVKDCFVMYNNKTKLELTMTLVANGFLDVLKNEKDE